VCHANVRNFDLRSKYIYIYIYITLDKHVSINRLLKNSIVCNLTPCSPVKVNDVSEEPIDTILRVFSAACTSLFLA
jgi:hypothetical protein